MSQGRAERIAPERRSARARRRARLRLAAIGLGAVLVLLAVGLAVFGDDVAITLVVEAPNAGETIDPADDPRPQALRELGVDRQLRVRVGNPPVSLSAWVLEPEGEDTPLATVLVLHGIRDEKRVMRGAGRRLTRHGMRAVLVDLRGHGRSEGEHMTYGVRETRDLRELLDALEARGLATGRVGAYGVSYGAAVAVQLGGRDPRVRAVVAIAPFASLREIAPVYARSYSGPLATEDRVAQVIDEAGRRAGFDPDRASPVRAVQRGNAHVLLFHGEDDAQIPVAHSRAIHRAAPERTRLVVVENAGHESITSDPGGQIEREAPAWLRRWLGEPGGDGG